MTEPLEKVVAHRAGLSRRVAATAIRRGRVTVAGTVVRTPRVRVAPQERIVLDGQALVLPPPFVVWHKPTGVHCTMGDPHGRRTLWSEVPELLNGGLRPVGRLDADTSGLLLLTTDGTLAQQLLHPKRGEPRSYVAQVEPAAAHDLADVLAAGVETAAGVFTAEAVTVEGSTVYLTVREGKHRMVRRMLANAGHPVVSLRRLAFGPFTLGELPAGAHREPTDEEAAWISDAERRVRPTSG